MADAQLEIALYARNKADAAFNEVKAHLMGLERTATLVKGALAGMVAGVTFAGTLRAFNDLANAAGDLQESMSMVATLFGSRLSRDIEVWAEGAAASMGLSKQAALEASGEIGNMFLQLGAGRGQSVEFSKTMIQLSADIASFRNVSGGAAQVLDAMQSAFRGEYDALQRFIPTINAAAVEHEALARSGKKSKDELTALEKAAAAYAIIIRDAGAAAGDFNRTSGSLANTARRLSTEWENFADVLGEKVLDSATRIKGITADILHNLTEAIKGPSLEDQIAAARAEYERLAHFQEWQENERQRRIGKYRERMAQFERDQMREYSQNINVDGGLFGGPNRIDPLEPQLDRDIQKAKELLETLEQIYFKRGFEEQQEERERAWLERLKSLEIKSDMPKEAPGRLPMLPSYPTAPPFSIPYAGDDTAWALTIGPGDAAEQSFRDMEEMIRKRNALMQKGNDELLKITQYTAEQMQSALSDFFFDAITGELKSFEDYWAAFWKSMAKMAAEALSQILIQQAIGQAASSSGSSGGNTGGGGYGWVGSLVNLVVAASRDSGGPVAPGGLYEIGVPEILRTGGKQYLMMGGNQGGYVEPLKEGGATSTNIRIINAMDPSIVEEWANSPSGERVILNIMRRNQ